MKIKDFIKNISRKNWLMSIIGFAIIFLIIILIGGFLRDGKIISSDIEGYKAYYSKRLGISFGFPKNYVVKKIDNVYYISKKFKKKEASTPYFTVMLAKDYNTPNEYLNDSTKKSKEEIGYTFTPVSEILSLDIKDKYASRITYNYVKNDTLTIENRYAFKYKNKIYAVSSYEEKSSESVNEEIVFNIISSITNDKN